jgi:hypothetical protein
VTLNSFLAALPMACLVGIVGCGVSEKIDPTSFPSSSSIEKVAYLSLPADDRAALLRAAAAALERNPDPLSVIHTEGTLPAVPSNQRAVQSKKDWVSISVLANAYTMTREPRFLDGYARYLAAWLDMYKISGNPIDETALGDWLLAYRSAGAMLPSDLAHRMRRFACDLAARYTQPQPSSRKTSTNNWQSHRVKLAVMGTHVCGKPELITEAEAIFARQIQDNLLPSGMRSTTWSTAWSPCSKRRCSRARRDDHCLQPQARRDNRSVARLSGWHPTLAATRRTRSLCTLRLASMHSAQPPECPVLPAPFHRDMLNGVSGWLLNWMRNGLSSAKSSARHRSPNGHHGWRVSLWDDLVRTLTPASR